MYLVVPKKKKRGGSMIFMYIFPKKLHRICSVLHCATNEFVTHTILHDLWSPPKNRGISNLVVWRSYNPAIQVQVPLFWRFLEGPCWFLGPINSQIWPPKTATSSCCTFLASCSMSRYSVSWERTNSHVSTKDWTCVWYISLTSRVGFGSKCR